MYRWNQKCINKNIYIKIKGSVYNVTSCWYYEFISITHKFSFCATTIVHNYDEYNRVDICFILFKIFLFMYF